MARDTAILLQAGDDLLGGSPVWDQRHGILYRVDAVARAVLALDVNAGTEIRFDLGRHVGSVTTRPMRLA